MEFEIIHHGSKPGKFDPCSRDTSAPPPWSYSKKPVNQLYIYSTVLGAAIRCKQYSEITVESGTHVKSVKITLNIFAVYV